MRVVVSGRIPVRINVAIALAIVVAHLAALVVLPAMPFVPDGVLVAAGAVAALGSPTHWALIHEAIHGVLLPRRVANERLARLLSILFGVPFRAVRLAHLRHHRYNRTRWGREEVYDPATCARPIAYAFHYLRITVGLYLGELALSLLCWLPRSVLRRRVRAICPDFDDGTPGMSELAEREVSSPAALAKIRIDAIGVVALYGSAFAIYGDRWPILAAMLLARAFISSQLDHAPHHATPLDRRDHALNLRAPRWLQAFLLNFNLHRTHHQHPHLPWRALPAPTTFDADDISFVRGVLRQWRGPIALREAGDSAH